MRDSYSGYFNDLHDSYQMEQKTNKMKLVYSYDDMASHLLSLENNYNACVNSDYIFFPSWGWILDSNYAIPEFYLKNKFGWRGSVFDVRDCGSLCVYYALHVMLKLNQHNAISTSCCCTIENEFEINGRANNDVIPQINYVALLSFSNEKKQLSDMRIIHCDIHCNEMHFSNLKKMDKAISSIAKNYDLLKNQYHIIMRNTVKKNNVDVRADLVAYPVSSGLLYDILYQISTSFIKIKKEYIFIVDIDLKTHFYGVLLIQQGECYAD